MKKNVYTDPKVLLQQGARSQLRKSDYIFQSIPMLMHFVSQARSNFEESRNNLFLKLFLVCSWFYLCLWFIDLFLAFGAGGLVPQLAQLERMWARRRRRILADSLARRALCKLL